jgi:hypothetical protein
MHVGGKYGYTAGLVAQQRLGYGWVTTSQGAPLQNTEPTVDPASLPPPDAPPVPGAPPPETPPVPGAPPLDTPPVPGAPPLDTPPVPGAPPLDTPPVLGAPPPGTPPVDVLPPVAEPPAPPELVPPFDTEPPLLLPPAPIPRNRSSDELPQAITASTLMRDVERPVTLPRGRIVTRRRMA